MTTSEYSQAPVWCFEIGKRGPTSDYEFLFPRQGSATARLERLMEFLWHDVFGQVKSSVLDSEAQALVCLPVPADVCEGRVCLARVEFVPPPEAGPPSFVYARMIALVADAARLAQERVPALALHQREVWERVHRDRLQTYTPPWSSLRDRKITSDVRVLNLESALLATGKPTRVEGLLGRQAADAVRAALRELSPEAWNQASFAINVQPYAELERRLGVVFPPVVGTAAQLKRGDGRPTARELELESTCERLTRQNDGLQKQLQALERELAREREPAEAGFRTEHRSATGTGSSPIGDRRHSVTVPRKSANGGGDRDSGWAAPPSAWGYSDDAEEGPVPVAQRLQELFSRTSVKIGTLAALVALIAGAVWWFEFRTVGGAVARLTASEIAALPAPYRALATGAAPLFDAATLKTLYRPRNGILPKAPLDRLALLLVLDRKEFGLSPDARHSPEADEALLQKAETDLAWKSLLGIGKAPPCTLDELRSFRAQAVLDPRLRDYLNSQLQAAAGSGRIARDQSFPTWRDYQAVYQDVGQGIRSLSLRLAPADRAATAAQQGAWLRGHHLERYTESESTRLAIPEQWSPERRDLRLTILLRDAERVLGEPDTAGSTAAREAAAKLSGLMPG